MEFKKTNILGNNWKDQENTLFIHKNMPIEDLSKLNNILWVLEVKV
jgi:hypothetical protein